MIVSLINRINNLQRKRKLNMLIQKGILTVGKNSDISNLDVVLSDDYCREFVGSPNIVIGSDCVLSCKISLYSISARVEIGNRVYIGHDTKFFCYEKIVVDDDVLLSWNINVIDTNAHSIYAEHRRDEVKDWKLGKKNWNNIASKPVYIKSKSWIGFNAIITKGVTVNEGAIVSCGSIVICDVKPDTIVGGNPAKIIKEIVQNVEVINSR